MSDCHRTWSVIPMAARDEVIKFWKFKEVQGQRSRSVGEVCALLSPSSQCHVIVYKIMSQDKPMSIANDDCRTLITVSRT